MRLNDAIPLADSTGAVRAYACPRCFRVSVSVSCGGNSAKARAEEAEHSKRAALRCGVCDCGARVKCGVQFTCDACRKRKREQADAFFAALPPRTPEPTPTIHDAITTLRALLNSGDCSSAEDKALEVVLSVVSEAAR